MQAKINNIQVLRAFAALAVVFFHTGFLLPFVGDFGAFGVEVFFVISGYIMARICETNADHFLVRRVIRIVPPYWSMTLLLYVAALCVPHYMGATRASFAELLKSLLFVPYRKSNGLLRPLLFVGWSLNYEMFFYLAISAALLVWRRRPLSISAVLIVTTMLLSRHFAGHGSAFADFYGDPYMLDFLCGFGVYELCRRIHPAVARRLRPLALLGLPVALFGFVVQHAPAVEHSFALASYLTVVSSSTLLVLSASLLSQSGWDTSLGWLILVGDASYILYLIHPFVEYTQDRVIGPHLPVLQLMRLPGCLLAVLLSTGAAVLGHLYPERPTVSFLNRRFGGKRRSAEMSAAPATPAQVAP